MKYMKEVPFLSVIVPVYNAELYLEQSIESVLEQSYRDFELILINDCSKDNSKLICENYAQRDKRIKVVDLKKNGGAGNARNIGIQHAKGQYITFMDSDDVIDKELYKNANDLVRRYNLDMVVWGMTEEYYNAEGKCYCINKIGMNNRLCLNEKEVEDIVIELEDKTLFGYQCNRFYRSSILIDHKIQFEKVILYEDYFFNLKVVQYIKTLGVIEDCGYHYMKRQNQSITSSYVPEYFELSTRRIATMYRLYEQWEKIDKKIIDILGARYLRYILAAIVKSYDSRAETNKNERVRMLKKIEESDLYQSTSKRCSIRENSLKIIQIGMNSKNWLFCLAVGRIIWVIREKLPGTFNRIRRFKG